MNWRRILVWTLGLLILLIGGLFVSVQTIDWTAARPRVESLVGKLTGRELKIKGDLDLRLLPTPTLTAGQVSFSNAAWGSGSTMFEAGSVGVTLKILPLLTTKVRIRTILLSDAHLLLETRGDGQGNWEFDSGKSVSSSDSPVFGSLSTLQINKLALDWKPSVGKAEKFDIQSVRMTSRQLRDGFDLDVSYEARNEDTHVTASLSSLGAYLRGDGLRGTVTSESSGASFKLDGDFGHVPSLDGINFQVTGKGTRWPLILRMARLATEKIPQWSVSTTLKDEKGAIRLDNLDLTIGNSDFSGHLVLDKRSARPQLSGRLSSKTLDLGIIGEFEVTDEASKSTHQESATVFSHKPVNLKWLNSFDASLDMKIGRFVLPTFEYTDAAGKIVLEKGRISADPFSGTLAGADASMSIAIDGTQAHRAASMSVTARHANVGEIVGYWFKPPFMTGKADFDVDIRGTGDSFGAVMATASGRLRLLVGAGTARAGIAEEAVKTIVVGTMQKFIGGKHLDTVKMNCFAADFEISSGIATATVLLLDTEHATVKGTGSIDLGGERWNLDLKPHPKKTTLTTAIPIDVRGTFHEPEFTVEKIGVLKKLAGTVGAFIYPPAAVGGLAELGSGNNVCLKIAGHSSPDSE
jgi:uncharacterized protein involved in outer membrane biogenesis